MPNGDSAIEVAAGIDEIGFPEFTTKLVSDVFDALVSANLRQQQAYIELLQATTDELSTYINNTKDDIGPEEILEFLSAVVPPDNPDADSPPTKALEGNTLDAKDVEKLNAALKVPDGALGKTDDGKDITNDVATIGDLDDESKVITIMDAVAIRLAANKYTLLEGMVKQGMLRLVVEGGVIQTRLNFRAFSSHHLDRNTAYAHRDKFEFRKKRKSSGFAALFANRQQATKSTSINVSTIDSKAREASNTTVDIFGEVVINFRTDYLPLDQA